MRLSTLAFLPGLAFAAFLPAAAMADDCSSAPYAVDVVTQEPQATLVRTANTETLAAFLHQTNTPGDIVDGLTHISYVANYNVALEGETTPGGVCMHATKVTVNWSFSEPPKIFLAAEIPEGSCRYDVVLDHENHHLQIGLDMLAMGKAELLNRIGLELRDRNYDRTVSVDAAKADYFKRIGPIVKEVTDRLSAEAAMRNMALDSPESYRQLSEACPR